MLTCPASFSIVCSAKCKREERKYLLTTVSVTSPTNYCKQDLLKTQPVKQFPSPQTNTPVCAGNVFFCRTATFKRSNFCSESRHINKITQFYRFDFQKE